MMSQIVLSRKRGEKNIFRRRRRKFLRRNFLQGEAKRLRVGYIQPPVVAPKVEEEKPLTVWGKLTSLAHSTMKFIRRK